MHAASLAGLTDAVLLDVTNHPLGVAVKGDALVRTFTDVLSNKIRVTIMVREAGVS